MDSSNYLTTKAFLQTRWVTTVKRKRVLIAQLCKLARNSQTSVCARHEVNPRKILLDMVTKTFTRSLLKHQKERNFQRPYGTAGSRDVEEERRDTKVTGSPTLS